MNPDGSESKQCFTDEHYDIAQNVNGNRNAGGERPKCDKRTVHYPVADSVVYAAIKSEPSSLSPPFEAKFNCGTYVMITLSILDSCAKALIKISYITCRAKLINEKDHLIANVVKLLYI